MQLSGYLLISHTSVKFRIGNYHIEALSHGREDIEHRKQQYRSFSRGCVQKGVWMRLKEICGSDCCEDNGMVEKKENWRRVEF